MSCRTILSKAMKENTVHVQPPLLTRWKHGLGHGYATDNGFWGDSITLQFSFPPHLLLKLNALQQNGAPEEILQFLEKECSFEVLYDQAKTAPWESCISFDLPSSHHPSLTRLSLKLNMRREIKRWRNTERSYDKIKGKE